MWIAGLVVALAFTAPGPDPTDVERMSTYRHLQEVPEARIWLDRGAEPVLQRGDRVRVSYRSSIDAYVAILQVDTDGTTRLLHPRSPTENHYVRAGRDYQLLFARSPYWHVDDRPGVGYLFIVTSPEPFDFSAFRYSYSDGGWDLSAVGARVQSDPYVAMDEYVAHLIPDWEYAEYALDFLSYDVGGGHEYPRFMCYDCHGFQPYGAWNPYRYTCANFRVVVYDDPYYYPAQRYRGDRVVFVTTGIPARPRYAFKARAEGESGALIVTPRAPRERDGATRAKRRASPTRPASGGRVAVPGRVTRRPAATSTRDVPATGARAPVQRRAAPPATGSTVRRPSLQRRPSSAARPSDRAGTSVRGSTRRPAARAVPSRAVKKPPARPATRARPKRSGGGSSSARGSATRSGPAARALPKRPGGSSAARSGNTRSRPAARKLPKRSGGGSSARARASSQVRKPGAKASKARRKRGGGGY